MIKSLDKLREAADEGIAHATDELKDFADKLAKDPSYAMSWSGDAFTHAAEHKVWSTVRSYCDDVEDPDNRMDLIIKLVQNNALRGARHPERSTSPASNLMNQEMTIAWASVLDRLKSW